MKNLYLYKEDNGSWCLEETDSAKHKVLVQQVIENGEPVPLKSRVYTSSLVRLLSEKFHYKDVEVKVKDDFARKFRAFVHEFFVFGYSQYGNSTGFMFFRYEGVVRMVTLPTPSVLYEGETRYLQNVVKALRGV